LKFCWLFLHKMKKFPFLILSCLLFSWCAFCQPVYNARILSWNVLHYPDPSSTTSDTSQRNPYFREIIQYINPDIFMVTELATANAYLHFLNYVMNASGAGMYSAGTFINGPDTDNAIYYRTNDFQFISNTPIKTALRDISEFKLVHIATGDTIRIYGCHLKASSGPANEAARAAEADSLRKVTNALSGGTDFIVCGDFNIYGDYEQAYIKLMQDNVTDDGNFIDVLNLPGVWNQPAYSLHHTQSTRFTSVGGGAPGGMNDRFDMMHFSNAVMQPGRITYIPNSFTNPGNDGMHYNQSINVMPNTAVPQNIADALYYASDHLPVYADFEFSTPTSVSEFTSEIPAPEIFPVPFSDWIFVKYFSSSGRQISIRLRKITGEIILESVFLITKSGYHPASFNEVRFLNPGIYFLEFISGDYFFRKKILKTQE